MLAKDQLVNSKKISGLLVRGFDSSLKFPLPSAYSREIMPANRSHIPTPEMVRKWPNLEIIADKLMPLKKCEVGLLVGYNCSRALAPRDVIPPVDNEPYGQRTDLGWGIVGIIDPEDIETKDMDPIGMSHRILTREVPSALSVLENRTQNDISTKTLSPDQMQVSFRTVIKESITPSEVAQMMELDFSERKSDDMAMSHDDRNFLSKMTQGIHLSNDINYQMPLPFRESAPKLHNNRIMAVHRLSQLEKRLRADEKYRRDYVNFVENIIQSGYATKVPSSELKKKTDVWYIPHHGVYHPKKQDCSAKYKGQSLNDNLLQGPDLTNTLVGVLCRFRQEPIAVICDIEQMFFQFRVNEEHRDYLRFLWWENGDYDNTPSEYRMNVHLFGAASSPGCSSFGLKQAANDKEMKYGSEAANFIRRDFYVDDGLKSLPTEEQAIDLIANSKAICSEAGLRLHKFLSNSKKVISTIPIEDQVKGIKDIDISCDQLPVERALGVEWCVESDAFRFRITLKDQPLTRRGILSTISTIFDPLRFVAPVILAGKQILQVMCREKADWDDPLPENLRSRWEHWRGNLFQLEELMIQRCFKPSGFGPTTHVELHHFSDASTLGYGQCSYLRLINDQDQVHCSFVMGKARVAPLKPMTIPRLELTVALVSVRVSSFLQRELVFEQIEEVLWMDSQVVLGYIRSDSRRFHVFVANRVQQIRDHTIPAQWRYVHTTENPADDGSRGLGADELVNSK